MKRPFYVKLQRHEIAPPRQRFFSPFGAALLSAVIFFPTFGCPAAVAESAPPPSVQGPDDAAKAEFDTVARTYGIELIEAVKEQNYRKFVARFASAYDSKEREKSFPALCFRIGKIIKSEYIGHLNREALQTYLWKVTVERSIDAGNGETRMATFDRLMQFTLVKADGKFQIVEFQFN